MPKTKVEPRFVDLMKDDETLEYQRDIIVNEDGHWELVAGVRGRKVESVMASPARINGKKVIACYHVRPTRERALLLATVLHPDDKLQVGDLVTFIVDGRRYDCRIANGWAGNRAGDMYKGETNVKVVHFYRITGPAPDISTTVARLLEYIAQAERDEDGVEQGSDIDEVARELVKILGLPYFDPDHKLWGDQTEEEVEQELVDASVRAGERYESLEEDEDDEDEDDEEESTDEDEDEEKEDDEETDSIYFD